MTTAFPFDTEQGVLRVQGELTIYQASSALEAFRAAVELGSLKQLDLADVSELDSAGLQLLLALKKESKVSDGPSIAMIKHSPAVTAVLALTNLSAQLDVSTLPGDA